MTPRGVLCAGLLAGAITLSGERLTARAQTDLLRGETGRVPIGRCSHRPSC